MRYRTGLFISIIVLAVLSAFFVYEPRRFAPIREQISRAVAAIPPVPLISLAPILGRLAPEASVASAVVPAPGTPARIVRVPAIRESQNYGWIQLPRGTQVDLVKEQFDGLLVRYDETFVVIPRAAVQDGSVVLRPKPSITAS